MIAKYEAERTAAMVQFNMYLTQPQAVADHPDVLRHCDEALRAMIQAESCLQKLNELITPEQNPNA